MTTPPQASSEYRDDAQEELKVCLHDGEVTRPGWQQSGHGARPRPTVTDSASRLKSNELRICHLPAATPRQASSQAGPPARSEEALQDCPLPQANQRTSLAPSGSSHEVGGAALTKPTPLTLPRVHAALFCGCGTCFPTWSQQGGRQTNPCGVPQWPRPAG